MKCKVVIFDLDGTLINSLPDLADSANDTMIRYGFPTHTIEEYFNFAGDGQRTFIERALPQDKNFDDTFVTEMVDYYNERCQVRSLNKTEIYDGVLEMIQKLQSLKIPLNVCSNKPHEAVINIVEKLFPKNIFDSILGAQKNLPVKPNPAMPLKLIEKYNVETKEVAFLGDTAFDMQTAVNAKMIGVGVTWGFCSENDLINGGADILIHKPNEIFKLIDFEK